MEILHEINIFFLRYKKANQGYTNPQFFPMIYSQGTEYLLLESNKFI
jgi:hypothetical protein